MKHDKFLLELLSGITSQQLFFLVWGLIVVVAVLMMNAHYRKSTRRNFRAPGDRGPRIDVDLRKLGDGSEGRKIVPRDNTPRK